MMREPSDWFLAPDHDNDGFYDANVDCKWIIYIPGIERIRFTVQNMDIQQFENCDLDYLEVRIVLNYEKVSEHDQETPQS